MRNKNSDSIIPTTNAYAVQVCTESAQPSYSCVCGRRHTNNSDIPSEYRSLQTRVAEVNRRCSNLEGARQNARNSSMDVPSTSSQVENGYGQMSSIRPCAGCPSWFSGELPLVEGVTKLSFEGSSSPNQAVISNAYTEDDADDEIHPPPSYSDLFEKPWQPQSNSHS